MPVEGVIDVDDNYDECYNLYLNGMQKGMEIGLSDIDDIITWERGRVAVVTGIPGHGKSEIVDFLALKLCLLYGWKIGYFSPENYPFKYHFSKLSSKLIGKSFDAKYMSKGEFDLSHQYISENISFVYPEDDMTFENILSKATYLVKRFGIKQFIIDPYNKIEHLRNKNESETDYVSRFLDRCCTFAKKYQVLFWIVAHPVKMKRKKDETSFEIPTLYDICGSSNFYNKPDYGLVVYRDFQNEIIELYVPKVKFKHLGVGGMAKLKYNFINGRLESECMSVESFNNKPYIRHDSEPEVLTDFPPQRNVNFWDTEPDDSMEIPF
jgi:twinkle protein